MTDPCAGFSFMPAPWPNKDLPYGQCNIVGPVGTKLGWKLSASSTGKVSLYSHLIPSPAKRQKDKDNTICGIKLITGKRLQYAPKSLIALTCNPLIGHQYNYNYSLWRNGACFWGQVGYTFEHACRCLFAFASTKPSYISYPRTTLKRLSIGDHCQINQSHIAFCPRETPSPSLPHSHTQTIRNACPPDFALNMLEQIKKMASYLCTLIKRR